MEETPRKVYEKGTELPCPLQAPLSQNLMCSQPRNSLQPFPIGFLWSLHYTGMINSLAIGDGFNLQPLSPGRSWGGADSSNPVTHGWVH